MENNKRRYFIVRSNFDNGRVLTETPVETADGAYPRRSCLRKDVLDRTNKSLSKQGIVFKDSQLFIAGIEELSEADYKSWLS